MTIEEFNKTSFGAGDKIRYTDGKEYVLASVDFQEKLFGILMHIQGAEDPNEISWIRCENGQHISA